MNQIMLRDFNRIIRKRNQAHIGRESERLKAGRLFSIVMVRTKIYIYIFQKEEKKKRGAKR